MVLDFEAIYSEARGDAFRSGKKRFYENRVSDLSYKEENGTPQICARVRGISCDRKVFISFDAQGGLYDYDCDCGNVLVSGPCRHIVAAALAYEDKFPGQTGIKTTAKTAKTDAAVFSLSTEYAKQRRIRRLTIIESDVTLLPVLGMYGDNRLSLRFTIGKTRRYMIKDVSDFVAAYQKSAYRRFGADLEFEVDKSNFDPQSQRLTEFLVASYREKAFIAADVGFSNARRDELPLLPGDTDEFFSLFEGILIQFEDNAQKEGMRLVEKGTDNLGAKLNIGNAPEGFFITSDFPKAQLIYGKKYHYLMTDTRIYRVTPDFSAAVWPLLKTLNLQGKLFVLEADMPLFYNNVLASLSGRLTLDAGNTDLERFEAAPFSAKLMLSLAPGGGITASLFTAYDDEQIDLFDDTFPPVSAVRDFEAEHALTESLAQFFPRCPDLLLTDENDIYRFLKEGAGLVAAHAEIELNEDVQQYKIKRPPRFRVGVRLDAGLLSVDFNAEEYSPAELKEILTANREKRAFIRLSDGSFVDLTDPGIAALSDFFATTGRMWAKKLSLPVAYAPYLDNELKNGMFIYERDAGFKALVKSLQTAPDAETQVPALVKNVLRNYQKTGFRWLKTLSESSFGGILADDMGLGKSLQIISLLLSDLGGLNLIVCPTSLILNWAGEFQKFAPNLKILPVLGNLEERKQLLTQATDADVVITSYELLRRDTELYENYNFRYAVLDEVQYIKNPGTRNAQAVKTLHAEHKFALTGTPIENALSELWSIFDFIMPGYLLSYTKFRQNYENGIARGNSIAANKFKKLIAPFILRRLKSEVLLELPPKIETDVVSPLEGEQKKIYQANLQLIRDSAAMSAEKPNKIMVLSMLTKLRQICCSPELIYPDYKGNSAKFDTCMELARSAISGGHKVLLFSQFTQMIELFRRAFINEGITHYVLKGDTLKSERMRLVNQFNADETNVFLISLKAGGTGLNLTGADVVIHYDPWWNESVTNQATDRAYRIGQDKPVQVYKLVLKDSVEQRILELQKKKSALSALVIGGAAEITGYEELLKILKEDAC